MSLEVGPGAGVVSVAAPVAVVVAEGAAGVLRGVPGATGWVTLAAVVAAGVREVAAVVVAVGAGVVDGVGVVGAVEVVVGADAVEVPDVVELLLLGSGSSHGLTGSAAVVIVVSIRLLVPRLNIA